MARVQGRGSVPQGQSSGRQALAQGTRVLKKKDNVGELRGSDFFNSNQNRVVLAKG